MFAYIYIYIYRERERDFMYLFIHAVVELTHDPRFDFGLGAESGAEELRKTQGSTLDR